MVTQRWARENFSRKESIEALTPDRREVCQCKTACRTGTAHLTRMLAAQCSHKQTKPTPHWRQHASMRRATGSV